MAYLSKKKQRAAVRRANRTGAHAWNRVCRTAKRLLASVEERQYEWFLFNFGSPMRDELKKLKDRINKEHRDFFFARCTSYDQGLRAHIFDEIILPPLKS